MAKRGVIFKEAPVIAPSRSWCDDSAKHDTSCNFGELIVGHVSDHMAHDVVKLRSSSFGFMEAMLAPSFGKCDLFSYWFCVNKRHIWPDWKKFRPNNDQLKTWEQMRTFVSPTMPYITLQPMCENSINLPSTLLGYYSSPSDHWNFVGSWQDNIAMAVFKVTNFIDDNNFNHVGFELLTPDLKYYFFEPESPFNYVLVVYKRNLKDLQSRFGNNWYKHDTELKSMNIFSVGNLFNYMGLSIHDVQKDRAYYFSHGMEGVMRNTIFPNSSVDPSVLYEFCKQYFVCSIFHMGDKGVAYQSFGFNDHDAYYYNYDSGNSTLDKVTNPDPLYPDLNTILTNLAQSDRFFKVYKHDLDTRINTLPIRAYEYIYDEYFRDENWIPVNTYTDFTRNGLESYSTAEQVRYFSIRKKAWSHDPYTSSLPGPQRGDAIRFLSDSKIKLSDPNPSRVGVTAQGITLRYGTNDPNSEVFSSTTGGTITTSGNQRDLIVDLSAATIENFRIANVRQRYEELFARTGGRYVEWQKGVMGANISEIEDERPIYIYGSRNPIQIAQVVQTSSTNVDTDQPLGDLAGRGVYQGKGDYIEFDCPDDCILMQIICVVPQQSYQTGINPIFTRHNWLDYPIPLFSQLGEEHVKLQNIWFNGSRSEDERSFGYQSRYWDWKYSRDQVTGQLATDLDFWTFSREFEDEPINGQDFLEVNVDYRQFAVQDRGVHHIYLSLYFDIQKNHALPVFGIPTL